MVYAFFQSGWLADHLDLSAAIVMALLLQLLLLKTLTDGKKLLKSNLLLSALLVLLSLSASYMPLLGWSDAALLVQECSTIGWGLVFLRLSSVLLFRLLLPAMRIKAPRILQDIVLVLGCIVWGLLRLRYAGLNLSGVVTTSAVITGILAFSMQDTLGNILGGLALQLDNSIRIGDWVRIDDVRGCVVEVHWRHTAVRMNNGSRVIIPNSILMRSKFEVFSSPDSPNWRRVVRFSSSAAVAPQLVVAAIESALRAAHIEHVATSPLPQCLVLDFAEGSTQYMVRYWLSLPQADESTDSIIRQHIYACLQRQGQGFEMGRPCMDINLANDTSERRAAQLQDKIEARIRTLAQVHLFSTLSREELLQVATAVKENIFARNDVMTKQGDVGHWMYLLVRGQADVNYEVSATERRHLATLSAGTVFGEMGLMTGEPRRATVTAKTHVECYRIDKPVFDALMQSRPDLAMEMAALLSERNQELLKIHEVNIKPEQVQHGKLLSSIKQFFKLSA
ncbi:MULTISPECIES: mechanosensitive ion channel family protein [unclassified Undibacterium]|uniref:mechanosensitive ion channel family protein n=2 Tax=Oxalobacteraceae TaxID=75682 RepID=UPI002AC8B24C|nr:MULTISPECIES: mechanosensitive ion channel family protein [unclassified Undibacterium]MEB0140074.1 mechanosensitive ion channel family protein [Undibacterium sp. CCC2.1]MEB0173184.1 mechanosensitive ion channel family protein [Undibacterium sp. CCC1.1]MEB0176889.1 mechanosensitive ion channel family protein [Undibacterium sp. CCC3.4]MEB0216198.1 mechanosensitive ion channel family protein [Undibacterium sp. 5I2]WPX41956.1 mechanosensitive ion channel family protein [Undibacterium sp. CCC3.4